MEEQLFEQCWAQYTTRARAEPFTQAIETLYSLLRKYSPDACDTLSKQVNQGLETLLIRILDSKQGPLTEAYRHLSTYAEKGELLDMLCSREKASLAPVKSEKPREDIATFLANLQKTHGKETAEITDALGITTRTYQRWIRGENRPPRTRIPEIAKFYGREVSEFYRRK